jgi:hypothetical protein
MFNDRPSDEMARERINERLKEVETYSLHKRLGFGDSTAARWSLLVIVILAVVVISLLL